MFGDLGNMMQQVKEMKGKMKEAQKELKGLILTGSSKNNEITVEVNGEMEIRDVRVTEAALSLDVDQLGKAIKEAITAALDQAKKQASSKLGGITGGLNLPGM